MDPKKIAAFTALFHQHARKCKKSPFNCRTCASGMKWFGELPPHLLSKALQDDPRPKFSTPDWRASL